MRLSNEAQAWLAATVQRVLARYTLPEAERAGIYYELMSHLHAAGEQKARLAGRDEVSVGDLQSALLDMGGEEAMAQAMVAPRAKPVPRAGIVPRTLAWVVDVIIIGFGWFVIAAVFWLSLGLFFLPFGAAGRFGLDPFDLFHDGPWPLFLGLWLLGLAYFVVLEGRDGRTLGKKVFNLRVQRLDGQPMTYREALIRNAVKVFPPLLVLDALFLLVFFHAEQQRVSDRLAETIVVEGP
jgi:uncharacterized RDD family membrane protein YckC